MKEQDVIRPIINKIELSLVKTVPSGYPTAKLKEQLTSLNLTCDETREEELMRYKKEVMKEFRPGNKQIFSIMKGTGNQQIKKNLFSSSKGSPTDLKGDVFFRALGLEKLEEVGSWILSDDAGGYRQELVYIIYPDSFDKLYTSYTGFGGTREKTHQAETNPTGQIIRDMFTSMLISVMKVIPGGISTVDIETILSVILGSNESDDPKTYEQDKTIYVFMIDGYDEKMQTANSIGGLSLQYKVHIEEYTDKGGSDAEAIVDIIARFVSYRDVDAMYRDLNWLYGGGQ